MLIKRFMKEKQFYNFDVNLKQALNTDQDVPWSGPVSGIPVTRCRGFVQVKTYNSSLFPSGPIRGKPTC